MERSRKLDKFARDAREWRLSAESNHCAATALFEDGRFHLWFPAATLGHGAIEMFLKAALIYQGMTVCDPRRIPIVEKSLTKNDCIWGHDLVTLAGVLCERCEQFELDAPIRRCIYYDEDLTVRRGLEIFDPFFSELRYPHESGDTDCLGPEHRRILDDIVAKIRKVCV